MKGFKHGKYEVYPAGQQLKNGNGSEGKWMALASFILWDGEKMQSLPVSWYPPLFDTEYDAATYAAKASKDMIDAGQCKL